MTQRIIDPLAKDANDVTEWPDGRIHQCRITDKQVLIDGVPIPDYIEKGGVEVIPGVRGQEFNRVKVTLIVSDIVIEDAAADQIKMTASVDPAA